MDGMNAYTYTVEGLQLCRIVEKLEAITIMK